MPTKPSRDLVPIPNPYPERDYEIILECPEFTCVCPMTGQPDFAKIKIKYIPAQKIVELKSLKLYLWSWREEGIYHEAVANRIVDDLVKALKPKKLILEADFNVRGGIYTKVVVKWPEEEK